ncbi:MAG: type III secretion system chaperone [Kiritimatiellae bacterium]|nr:type III secretion system chaperone [Kiritimatiellia bacterium]MBQ6327543.1 type III secretion system chaperone [Kiritimatiellia bacterium]
MEDIETELRELGEKNGFDISLDENDACTLELADGRPVVLQLRAALNELDFVAILGSVPDDRRADVFADLLSANYYWQETLGATLSWNPALEQVVLIYPFPLADATPESLESTFERFLELQAAWKDRLAELASDEDEPVGGDDSEGGDPSDMIINP